MCLPSPLPVRRGHLPNGGTASDRRSRPSCGRLPRLSGGGGEQGVNRVMVDTKPTNGSGAWQDVRVSLGPDAEVTGKLSFATPTRIEGKLKGEVRATDLLVIGPQAVVQASVMAEKLVVLGEVRGQVQNANRVEICSGGRLFGDIETRALVV